MARPVFLDKRLHWLGLCAFGALSCFRAAEGGREFECDDACGKVARLCAGELSGFQEDECTSDCEEDDSEEGREALACLQRANDCAGAMACFDDVTPASTPGAAAGCTNTCRYRLDGECDDGRPGAITSACAPGTDCADCEGTPISGDGDGDANCTNTCDYPFDGECDDGRPGSVTDLCEPGTDCGDCGPAQN